MRGTQIAAASNWLVVVPAFDNLDALVKSALALDAVDKSVRASNPARPPAAEVAFQRLRLSQPLMRRPAHVPDQDVYFF